MDFGISEVSFGLPEDEHLALSFGRSARPVRPVGGGPQSTRVNIFDGAVQHRDLRTFGRVDYPDVWAGIDISLRPASGRVKYDVVVGPGASVSDIDLVYEGAESLTLDANGDLVVDLGSGVITDTAPVAWQNVEGERVEVPARFTLGEDGSSFGFEVGAYDRSRPLIIDPAVVYTTFVGQLEGAWASTADQFGNAYIVGSAWMPRFEATPGAIDATSEHTDAFLVKYDPTGSVVFATFIGGTGHQDGNEVHVDEEGHIYVGGYTQGGQVPVTPSGSSQTASDNETAFLTKLSANGDKLLMGTTLPGARYIRAIDTDRDGHVYLAGHALSSMKATPDAFDTTFSDDVSDNTEGYVLKLQPDGSDIEYAGFVGGAKDDFVNDLKVDKTGAVYVSGTTYSSDFTTTEGAFDRAFDGGSAQGFVQKISPSGGLLVFSTLIGGSGGAGIVGVELTNTGDPYLVGWGGPDFPTTAGPSEPTGGGDGFAARLTSDGSELAASRYFGGSDFEDVRAVRQGPGGDLFVVGVASAGFPVTEGEPISSARPSFVARFNSDTEMTYSESLAIDVKDFGVDAGGSVYLAGWPVEDGVEPRISTAAAAPTSPHTRLDRALTECTIEGTSGDDLISGTRRPDVICAAGGDDRIEGLGGNDVVLGGFGDDVLVGGRGTDLLFGSAGHDRIRGGNSRDLLRGGSGEDALIGAGGRDLVFGGSGGSEVAGGPGGDLLVGGRHGDAIDGGGGNDVLRGRDGRDALHGNAGRDRIGGGSGFDTCGGGDRDRFRNCEDL